MGSPRFRLANRDLKFYLRDTPSELGLANYAAGGPELTIIYQIKRNPQKVNRVICPDI
jgi:hypothetical protein